LYRGFTGNSLSGADLFGNASSFKTINRDNFINFAAEISLHLGRVILIRSAGSRRGTSGAAWTRCGSEREREGEIKGERRSKEREGQKTRGDREGKEDAMTTPGTPPPCTFLLLPRPKFGAPRY